MAEPSDRDLELLRQAIKLAENCPPAIRFSVGAVIADAAGGIIATGYTGEGDPVNHAEEAALAKLDPKDSRLSGATMYCSLEPCSERTSRPTSCTQLILAAGIPRIVFAWREPEVFVDGQGAELLTAAGREIIEVAALARLARRTNAHVNGIEE